MEPILQYFMYGCIFALGLVAGRLMMAIQVACMRPKKVQPTKVELGI